MLLSGQSNPQTERLVSPSPLRRFPFAGAPTYNMLAGSIKLDVSPHYPVV